MWIRCDLFYLCLTALFVISPITAQIGGKPPLAGGYSNADTSDPNIQNAGQKAVELLQKMTNSMNTIQLINIQSAQKQVVAGVNYKMTVIIGYCRVAGTKAADRNPSSCTVTTVTKYQKCEMVLWSRPWLSDPNQANQLTSSDCKAYNYKPSEQKQRVKRAAPLLGGQQPADKSSDLVKSAASFFIHSQNSEANGLYAVQLSSVKEAYTQIVAGVIVRLTLDVVLTSCADRSQLVDHCSANALRRETRECTASIWDQAWRTPRYVLQSFKCSDEARASDNNLRFVKNGNKTPKLRYNENMIGRGGHDGGERDDLIGRDDGHEDRAVYDTRPRIGYSFEDFQAFKAKHGRVYKSMDEESQRYIQFRDNMRRAQFIQDHDLGDATFGATMFADWTPEEFSAYVSKPWNKNKDDRLKVAEIPKDTPPVSFDWRDHGAITPVKNQGSCGSCWAFSVTGNIEGQWAIKKGALVSLSEQELVDCDKLDEGCNGGLPANAYEEIQRLGGLEDEDEYPYKGDDEKCVFTTDKVKVYINGSLNISSNEDDMAAWLYKNGPMSIGINAMAMQFYFGGISHPWKLFCPDALDHGVLIVGYGVKKGHIYGETPYWIVKNSWGSGWGEKGYYLVYRGDGTCGLNEMVSSAVIN